MVSVNRRTLYGEVFNDVRCLSSDEKPTEGIKNGSTLIEIDTGKRYLYDALSGSWNEFSQGGGGEYVLPTMSQSVKGGATLGEGLSMSGDSLSVDYSKVASKQSLDDATKVDPDGGLKRTTDGLSADYSEVASVESLESATKLEAGGGIKRTSNGLSVDYSEVASVDALEEATALSPTGGIVSTQDGLAISPEQSSTGAIDGALLELTAKSKPATQASTTGKNLLPNNATSQTISGVTFTVNDDGSVTANGTATLNAQFRLCEQFNLAAGSYVLSGCADGGGSNTYEIRINDSSTNYRDYGSYGSNRDFTLSTDVTFTFAEIIVRSGKTVSGLVFKPQLELGSTATPYEPYTGGAPSPSPDYPQEIVTVRGRNLLPNNATSQTVNGVTFTVNADGSIMVNGTASANTSFLINTEISLPSATYTLSSVTNIPSNVFLSIQTDAGTKNVRSNRNSETFSAAPSGQCWIFISSDAVVNNLTIYPQLTLSSAPQPYVPYGHVGLERRDSQGTLLDTTPIPLPSRGWVAGLPDGTADELTVDGAGKVVWTEQTDEVVLYGSETWAISGTRYSTSAINSLVRKATAGNVVMPTLASAFAAHSTDDVVTTDNSFGISTSGALLFRMDSDASDASVFTTWLSTHPVTVLYPLATPVIEDCGYIEGWTNDFSEGCVLSIPELDDLGVKYHIDGAVSTLVHQWYERARYDYEDRIDALESAVAELVAGA